MKVYFPDREDETDESLQYLFHHNVSSEEIRELDSAAQRWETLLEDFVKNEESG